MTTGSGLDTALWDGFHRAADLSSRELSDWLRSESGSDHAAAYQSAGADHTNSKEAGDGTRKRQTQPA
ncbi:hypothetical protein ACRCUN_03555 [Mycobacterium sp. LTG2003]